MSAGQAGFDPISLMHLPLLLQLGHHQGNKQNDGGVLLGHLGPPAGVLRFSSFETPSLGIACGASGGGSGD
ncbi:MAG: hypothetical protein C4576_31220 [Desulfobacteraceae bacterium]|nr:MAG: hypothetical protein C4576_31220 [Desulfobacteraceae bacterium]